VNSAGEKVRKTLEHMNVGADLDAATIGVQSFTDIDGNQAPASTAAGQSSSSKSLGQSGPPGRKGLAKTVDKKTGRNIDEQLLGGRERWQTISMFDSLSK
jgi:hypothetical protein